MQLENQNMSKKPPLDLSATHHQIATYLTDYALSELVRYEMEDTGCNIEQAMERVYNSPIINALQDEEGERRSRFDGIARFGLQPGAGYGESI